MKYEGHNIGFFFTNLISVKNKCYIQENYTGELYPRNVYIVYILFTKLQVRHCNNIVTEIKILTHNHLFFDGFKRLIN